MNGQMARVTCYSMGNHMSDTLRRGQKNLNKKCVAKGKIATVDKGVEGKWPITIRVADNYHIALASDGKFYVAVRAFDTLEMPVFSLAAKNPLRIDYNTYD